MSQPLPISAAVLAKVLNSETHQGSGWVFYRFPDSAEINFMGGKVFESTIDKAAGSCFLIAPFYRSDNLVWHIENSLHFTLADNDLGTLHLNVPFYHRDDKVMTGGDKPEYKALVHNIIEEIRKGNMQKAVAARTKLIRLDTAFSPFGLYKSLLNAYPNAFVYMLSTPETGTWIGCTPEKLLQVNKNEINAVSLAGTVKTNLAIHARFSSKEIDEQAIVTLYIQSIIKKYCEQIILDGPHPVRAGNVFHLATYMNGILMPQFEDNYLQILKDLHPTPAVCGMPLKASRDFLLQRENFSRELYSGFLGPINSSEAEMFVNLRCIQVFHNSALLYAGAGVVSGSIPEKEWLETEEKMNTLLRFL